MKTCSGFLLLLCFSLGATSFLNAQIIVIGKVSAKESDRPLSYVNIGVFEANIGTISDPDGSFILEIPNELQDDTLIFSLIGYDRVYHPINQIEGGEELQIILTSTAITLDPVVVEAGKKVKSKRLGWMRGGDGTLPVESSDGGACTTLLLKAPSAPFYIDEVHLRILYNTKDTILFRLRLFDVDPLTGMPGDDFLEKEVFIKAQKRAGWIKQSVSDHQILVPKDRFYLGFEWIENRANRDSLISSFKDFYNWKKEQFLNGDPKVIADSTIYQDKVIVKYIYNGNMMNWPGFNSMPPWTGLVLDDKDRPGNEGLITYERKMSFGKWRKRKSVLNTVLVISY